MRMPEEVVAELVLAARASGVDDQALALALIGAGVALLVPKDASFTAEAPLLKSFLMARIARLDDLT